jgi:hypothetical protein
MATPLSPEVQAEIDNAIDASEEMSRNGTTSRRCLRCGGELRLIDHGRPGGGYQIRCEREQRIILTVRA